VKGKIEAAAGGTLLLDEIGEMPMAMQAKLLRFLENLKFMRVGGAQKIEADVRLMFATLRPLEQEVAAGRFRGDLYYRIQGITLHVPPLRERRADIAPLLAQFLAQLSARHGVTPPHLSRSAKAMLLRYDWPGNVRELRNVIETLCLLREGRQIRPVDLPQAIRAQHAKADPSDPGGATLTVDLDGGLDAIVQQVVETALARADGNKQRAASRLRISLRTIQRYVAAGQVRAD
jgi:DNA-binding NtrC family response regulator